MSARVAVVDDDPELLELFKFSLERAGFVVLAFPAPARFLDALEKARPDACVLDMRLPGMHGRDLIRVLRADARTRVMPIVAVSAVDQSSFDKATGFELGADEYFGKPVDLELLAVRLTNLLARTPAPRTKSAPSVPELRYKSVRVSPDERRVELAGKAVDLTRKEFDLLVYFLTQPGRVMTRGLLLEKVWGGPGEGTARTVDKHIETLRRKLPAVGARVETVVGVGYLFRP